MDLCQDSQDFSDYSSILSSEKDLTYGVSAGKRDQIEFFFKKKFLSKIDVDLIIWSRIFVISKKIFLSIWSLFPALTPYKASQLLLLQFFEDSIYIGMYSRCNEGENLYTCVHVLQYSVDFLETKLLKLSYVQWNDLQYVVNCPHLEM